MARCSTTGSWGEMEWAEVLKKSVVGARSIRPHPPPALNREPSPTRLIHVAFHVSFLYIHESGIYTLAFKGGAERNGVGRSAARVREPLVGPGGSRELGTVEQVEPGPAMMDEGGLAVAWQEFAVRKARSSR